MALKQNHALNLTTLYYENTNLIVPLFSQQVLL